MKRIAVRVSDGKALVTSNQKNIHAIFFRFLKTAAKLQGFYGLIVLTINRNYLIFNIVWRICFHPWNLLLSGWA